jgi:hypothetical protein
MRKLLIAWIIFDVGSDLIFFGWLAWKVVM